MQAAVPTGAADQLVINTSPWHAWDRADTRTAAHQALGPESKSEPTAAALSPAWSWALQRVSSSAHHCGHDPVQSYAYRCTRRWRMHHTVHTNFSWDDTRESQTYRLHLCSRHRLLRPTPVPAVVVTDANRGLLRWTPSQRAQSSTVC
jgi:hypothetical protein